MCRHSSAVGGTRRSGSCSQIRNGKLFEIPGWQHTTAIRVDLAGIAA
jgi:hypothetical protein